jgi:hypothetical protein
MPSKPEIEVDEMTDELFAACHNFCLDHARWERDPEGHRLRIINAAADVLETAAKFIIEKAGGGDGY